MNDCAMRKDNFLFALSVLWILLFFIACTPNQGEIKGRVINENGDPISSAVVRVRTSENKTVSDKNGLFSLTGLPNDETFFITAWVPGYYINGIADIKTGTSDVEIILHKLNDTDNADYVWLPSTYLPGEGENQGCAKCHSNIGSELTFALPVDEWLMDAHSQSAHNQRFLSMYKGSDIAGNQSPLTRYSYNRDYGLTPLRPDPDQLYFGPGYKLDFPATAGNCATCHTPMAAIDNAYGIDPTMVSGTESEGISCDFCHKISDVNLNSTSGLPNSNMPGVLSFDFLRPPEGHQFFAGPLDDVAPGEDTYSAIQQQSQFCAPCHYGVFWDTVIYNSFGEWLESPYSDPETGLTCQDCHMPPTGATMFVLPDQGGQERNPDTIFSHYMPGAMDETLLQNAVTMTVNSHREENKIIVEVTILNDQTGHHVPTDSPLRQLILLVKAQDKDGETIQLLEGPTVPEWGGVGNPAQGYFAGLPGKGYAKILMELWTEKSPTGAYWNPTRIVSDNRLAAYESDTTKYVFESPSGGSVIIDVELLFRRAFIVLMDQKGWEDVPDILMQHAIVSVPVQS